MADPYSQTETMEIRDTSIHFTQPVAGASLDLVQVSCINSLDIGVTVYLQGSPDATFAHIVESAALILSAGATDFIATEGERFAYWRIKAFSAEVPTSGTLSVVWSGVYPQDPYTSVQTVELRTTDPQYTETISNGLELETLQVTCINNLDQAVTLYMQAATSSDSGFAHPIDSEALTIAPGTTDFIVTEGELYTYWRAKFSAADTPSSGAVSLVWTGAYSEIHDTPGYADLTRVKTFSGVTYTDLGLSTDDAYDALLDGLNAEVADTIDTYCGQTFGAETGEVETHSGDGSNTILLKQAPITGLTSVVEDGTTLSDTDYYLDTSTGVLWRRGGCWSVGEWNIVVTYDYGYVTPPAAISRVAEEICIAALKAAKVDRALQGLDSVSMDGFSGSRGSFVTVTPGQVSAAEMQTLNKYRRVVCA